MHAVMGLPGFQAWRKRVSKNLGEYLRTKSIERIIRLPILQALALHHGTTDDEVQTVERGACA